MDGGAAMMMFVLMEGIAREVLKMEQHWWLNTLSSRIVAVIKVLRS